LVLNSEGSFINDVTTQEESFRVLLGTFISIRMGRGDSKYTDVPQYFHVGTNVGTKWIKPDTTEVLRLP
jgi:hypothetical protein